MESKESEDILLTKLIGMIKPDMLKDVVTLKHLKLKEGRELELLYALLHCMLCGPRGTRVALVFGDKSVIIRDMFFDFTHRGWLTLCVDALKLFGPRLAEARDISPYFRSHHTFWPSGIDIDSELKKRREFFDGLRM
jgi:hypothetical protein